jgi:hypothetical protein
MINYTSNKQQKIEDFEGPFDIRLNKDNRWVKLANELPWDELVSVYHQSMKNDSGAKSIDSRVVIGAVIIKHIEGLDDRGTIQAIQENPYMQYFLGLSNFTGKPVFTPSLFVAIRKRLGIEQFEEMNRSIIKKALEKEIAPTEQDSKSKGEKKENDDEPDATQEGTTAEPQNQGKLQMDATVADAHIKYPTDLDILNDSREKAEELVDMLYEKLKLAKKPRTYRNKARQSYLNLSKKRRKNGKEIRKGIKQQINFLERDIRIINQLLDKLEENRNPMNKRQLKYFFVIQHVVEQQKQMYDNHTHSIPDRIVSIHQPHVRPIVRGKAGANVEFGAKINIGLQDGYATIDHLDFNAFNESQDLIQQVEKYKDLRGHYPELVLVDQIYLTRENRKWLKGNNIRHIGKPLGRPVKEVLTTKEKREKRQQAAERNHVEGKFGQGKNAYGLNKIRARLSTTSRSWVAAIFFVMNLVRFSKDFLLPLLFYQLFALPKTISLPTFQYRYSQVGFSRKLAV